MMKNIAIIATTLLGAASALPNPLVNVGLGLNLNNLLPGLLTGNPVTSGTTSTTGTSNAPGTVGSPLIQPLPVVLDFENKLPLISTEPIGPSLNIYWNGMSVLKSGGLQNLIIVEPNTPYNYATFSSLNLATLREGQPSMRASYPGSKTNSFDLLSFYYGCALATQVSIATVPVSCSITIKGYSDDAGQKLVGTQTFTYTVPGLLTLSTKMQKATVNNFKNVKKVDFSVSNSLTTAALLDTVSYIIHSK